MKKIIIAAILISFLLGQPVQARMKVNPEPFYNYMEEVGQVFLDFLGKTPENVEKTFKEKVLPVWNEMNEWFTENIWEKIKPQTKEEIERRKRIVEEEVKKEREELLEELSTQGNFFKGIKDFLKNFWQ